MSLEKTSFVVIIFTEEANYVPKGDTQPNVLSHKNFHNFRNLYHKNILGIFLFIFVKVFLKKARWVNIFFFRGAF